MFTLSPAAQPRQGPVPPAGNAGCDCSSSSPVPGASGRGPDQLILAGRQHVEEVGCSSFEAGVRSQLPTAVHAA